MKEKVAEEKRIHTQVKNELKVKILCSNFFAFMTFLFILQNLLNHVETLKASVEKQQKLVESKTVSTEHCEKYDEELKQTKKGTKY